MILVFVDIWPFKKITAKNIYNVHVHMLDTETCQHFYKFGGSTDVFGLGPKVK